MSPTQRTRDELKKLGFTSAIVERWNPHAKVRQDLFGCLDLVAMKEGIGILGIQATSGANHAARRDKAMAEPRLKTWLLCGARFEIWSWSKKGARGKRKKWELRRDELFAHDIGGTPTFAEALNEIHKAGGHVWDHTSLEEMS